MNETLGTAFEFRLAAARRAALETMRNAGLVEPMVETFRDGDWASRRKSDSSDLMRLTWDERSESLAPMRGVHLATFADVLEHPGDLDNDLHASARDAQRREQIADRAGLVDHATGARIALPFERVLVDRSAAAVARSRGVDLARTLDAIRALEHQEYDGVNVHVDTAAGVASIRLGRPIGLPGQPHDPNEPVLPHLRIAIPLDLQNERPTVVAWENVVELLAALPATAIAAAAGRPLRDLVETGTDYDRRTILAVHTVERSDPDDHEHHVHLCEDNGDIASCGCASPTP